MPDTNPTTVRTNDSDNFEGFTYAEINEAIKAQATCPTTFSVNAENGWAVSGAFAEWSIAPGGAGSLLLMRLVVEDGKLTVGETAKPFSGTVLIEPRAEFVPDPGKPGSILNLIVIKDAHVPVIRDGLTGDLRTLDRAVVRTLLSGWLEKNLASYVLASVNLKKELVTRPVPVHGGRTRIRLAMTAAPTPAAPADSDQGVAYTNGWDTVAAITYTEVNKAIKAYATYPKTFSHEADDKSVAASGTFTGWSLTTGGAGPLVHIQLAIEDGKLTPDGEATKPFSGTMVVQVNSTFVPQQGKSSTLDLKLDKQGPVSAISADLKGLSSLYRGSAQQLLVDWLGKNLEQFNNVFASVNLDRALVKDGIPWLAPSAQGYAVAEPMQKKTLDNSVFAIMCLIDGKKPSGTLEEQASPFAIPSGHRAGFLISQEKFLSHIMKPGLALPFAGIDGQPLDDIFDVASDGTTIQNKKQLTMRSYKLGDMTVNPIVEAQKFQFDCGATEMKLSIFDMWFDVPLFGFIKDALTAKITYNGRYRMRLDESGHALGLDIIQESSSASLVSSKAWIITQAVLGGLSILACITGVGFVVAGARAAGAAAAGAAVAAGEGASLGAVETGELVGAAAEEAFATTAESLTSGTQSVQQIGINFATAARISFASAGALGLAPAIGMIQNGVASGQIQNLPPIKNLIDTALGTVVKWPASLGQLNLTSAQLNGSLQIGMK